ncbi:MAG: type II secretion system protein [Alphaproteobacteria bacterium]|nr:type II secretion system protein [Alphaproteobacteria bacterium]
MTSKRKLSDSPLLRQRTDKEQGRSMIEMLGVLAIVGALSVGALAGYSIAMTNHKINKATEEIRRYIIAINDLFADNNNYDGLSNDLLTKAGIFPLDLKNAFGLPIFVYDQYNTILADTATYKFDYIIPNDHVCQKILLSGIIEELGKNNLEHVSVWYPNNTGHLFKWDGSGNSLLPPSIADAQAACSGAKQILFFPY